MSANQDGVNLLNDEPDGFVVKYQKVISTLVKSLISGKVL